MQSAPVSVSPTTLSEPRTINPITKRTANDQEATPGDMADIAPVHVKMTKNTNQRESVRLEAVRKNLKAMCHHFEFCQLATVFRTKFARNDFFLIKTL